jgi:hypothetical protein
LIDVASALETLESTLNPRSRNFIFLLADPLPHFCVASTISGGGVLSGITAS